MRTLVVFVVIHLTLEGREVSDHLPESSKWKLLHLGAELQLGYYL